MPKLSIFTSFVVSSLAPGNGQNGQTISGSIRSTEYGDVPEFKAKPSSTTPRGAVHVTRYLSVTAGSVRRRNVMMVAVALFVFVGVLASAPAADAAEPTGLVVSLSSDRSNPQTLDGATLAGDIYISVAGYPSAKKVEFTLDGGRTRTRRTPFDYRGTTKTGAAKPLATTKLVEGEHTLIAVVLGRRKSYINTITATFTVANEVIVLPPPPPPPDGKTLVPAYFYPGPEWTRMCDTLHAGSIAIMNPSSGPGTAIDPSYEAAVDYCRSNGIDVVGYVHTVYGTRSADYVRAEVDAYFDWYGVDGIFFDQASTDSGTQGYYADMYQYVHAKGSGLTVVTNPGAAATSAWQLDGQTADIVNVFEGSASDLLTWSPPSWIASQDANELAMITYSTPEQNEMEAACVQAKTLNLGWSYVTPDVLTNPFDTLPLNPYWSAELAACS